ncbi:RidA family protein [Chitiniphilus eburneus]|uniref:RidA family protein n=1 Tax=Chitiniphilus eburneus TaxID=2571148 RepID=A0A4U0QJI1_9NEIS|nr:RidA family protein [Chitiniphilus eburneus]TJZ76224.1 RidA family protein [Chitiniphilus eburneus]
MTTTDLQRINPTPLWSDAVCFNGTGYFVEVPESGTDFTAQTRALLAQAERTLHAIGSDKARLLMVTIYLPDLAHRQALNELWREWLPEGCAPARACVRAELASPDLLIEMAFVAALQPA